MDKSLAHITLISGAELVAEIDDGAPTFSNILRIQRALTEKGEYVMFVNLTPFQLDEHVTIPDDKIITKTVVSSNELKTLYNEYLSSYVEKEIETDTGEFTGTLH